MSSLGEPTKLRDDILPTELDIYNHFIVLRNEKLSSGEWSKFTPMALRLTAVMVDVTIAYYVDITVNDIQISLIITKNSLCGTINICLLNDLILCLFCLNRLFVYQAGLCTLVNDLKIQLFSPHI